MKCRACWNTGEILRDGFCLACRSRGQARASEEIYQDDFGLSRHEIYPRVYRKPREGLPPRCVICTDLDALMEANGVEHYSDLGHLIY